MIVVQPDTGNEDEDLLVYYVEKDGFIYCLSELTTGLSYFGETPITVSGWKVPRTKQKLKNQLRKSGVKDRELKDTEVSKHWKELNEKVYKYLQKEKDDSLSPFYIDYENDVPNGTTHLKEDDFRNLFL